MYNIIDMHLHSTYSWDAQQSVEEIIKKAREKGITQLGLTEHFDFHRNHPKSYMFLDYHGYSAKVAEVKKDFPGLMKGIEVGEPYLHPEKYESFMEGKEFDYVMGSVHWIDAYSPVDERYFHNFVNAQEAYIKYLEEEFKLVTYGKFDVAPHVTLVHRRGKEFLPEYTYAKFKNEIDDILKVMIKNKIALEVNCSGLRMEAGDFIPDKAVIEAYLKLGGDMITVGSDSHRVQQTFFGLEKAYEMLDGLGVTQQVIFDKRKAIKVPLKVE